jgi:hypothetical protein
MQYLLVGRERGGCVCTLGVTKQQALLCGHLEQVAAVLAPLRDIDEALFDRLEPLLQLEVAKLSGRVERAVAAANPWAELRDVRDDAIGLFTECLGFLGGAVALHAKLDAGRCRIANHLVATLRRAGELPGPVVSVPAEREYVNCMSSLIRLRFPGEGLWDLPVVVHELGHAVCDQLGARAARDAVIAAAAKEQANPGRLLVSRYEELWADVFATYVAGPSYAATCLRLRFDPSLAGAPEGLATHPSVEKRAAVILATLGHVEERRRHETGGAIAGSVADTLTELQTDWLAELAAADRTAMASQVAKPALAAADSYCALLDSFVPTLRFPGLAIADGARYRLKAGQARPPSAGILDVLNAAWLARLDIERDGQPVEYLAERAVVWCAEAADG